MSDRIVAVFGGFVEISTRNGWHGLIRADEIDHVLPRREGGTTLNVRNLRAILLDVPINKVIAAMREAGSQQPINGGINDD
jgi:hypothetical protein